MIELGGTPKTAPASEHIVDGTDATFMQDVIEVSKTIPVIVDFWAPWCGPCRMMAPAYEQAAGLLEPQVRVAKLNTEEAQAISARFNIRSIPTLALFVGGKEVARQAGAFRSAQDIADWTRSHL